MVNKMSFTAYHAPSGEYKSGFETEKLADAYIEEQAMKCRICSSHPEHLPCEATMCEWFVMPTDQYEKCNDFKDILKASGYTEVEKP